MRPAPKPALRPVSTVSAPPVYRPGQPAAILRSSAIAPRVPPPAPHSVLQRMPGLRIERRLPPPVYRPGSPAVSAKIGGPPVRPVIVQRALDEYALARTQYDTNLTAALIEYGRTISAGNVRLVVTAHPPDDRYLVESTDNYIARVRDHLDPHDYKGRPKEKALINAALEQYRDELRAAAQRAEEQRRASLVILAEFERQASTRPQTKKIKEHMFSAEVDGKCSQGAACLHQFRSSWGHHRPCDPGQCERGSCAGMDQGGRRGQV